MTVDKSQGSQFKNVFIDVSDIMDINYSSRNYNNILLQKVKIALTLLSDEYPDYKVYSKMTNTKLIINIYPFN